MEYLSTVSNAGRRRQAQGDAALVAAADVAATKPVELSRVTEQDSGLLRSAAMGVKVLAVACLRLSVSTLVELIRSEHRARNGGNALGNRQVAADVPSDVAPATRAGRVTARREWTGHDAAGLFGWRRGTTVRVRPGRCGHGWLFLFGLRGNVVLRRKPSYRDERHAKLQQQKYQDRLDHDVI